jgi:checkpoint serine/threonine-protein kinase
VLSSEYQVTFNPATGKKTRIHVDLATLYPTPDVPGTELSFEEVWLRNRGWMDTCWDDEPADENSLAQRADTGHDMDALGWGMSEKLVVHQDPALFDENGAVKDSHKASKGKKMKLVEVNRTQISKSFSASTVVHPLTRPKSRQIWTRLPSRNSGREDRRSQQ